MVELWTKRIILVQLSLSPTRKVDMNLHLTSASAHPTMHVRLSRGSELCIQRRQFRGPRGGMFTLDAVLLESSGSAVTSFCDHWIKEFLKSDVPAAKLLGNQRPYGTLGVVSVRPLEEHRFVILYFHPYINGGIRRNGHFMGNGRLGLPKEVEIKPARIHALRPVALAHS